MFVVEALTAKFPPPNVGVGAAPNVITGVALAGLKATVTFPALLLLFTVQLVPPVVHPELTVKPDGSVHVPTVEPPVGVAVYTILSLLSKPPALQVPDDVLPLYEQFRVVPLLDVAVTVPVPEPVKAMPTFLASVNAVWAAKPED